MKQKNNYAIKLLFVDDDHHFVSQFTSVLKGYFQQNNIIAIIESYTELSISFLKKKEFDFAFLDIDMPKINGFNLARELKRVLPNCRIVYISSKMDLIVDSFDYSSVENFIPKGCSSDLLKRKLDNIFHQYISKDYLILQGKVSINIPVNTIIHMNKDRNNLYITTTDNIYCERKNLKDILDELNLKSLRFIQVHKSVAINLSYILKFDNDNIYLNNGEVIRISRSFKHEVKIVLRAFHKKAQK